MTIDLREAPAADEPAPVALAELAELSGLSEADLLELVDYGALVPTGGVAGGFVFGIRSVTIARSARRLREAFELEAHGVALMLACLDRIRELEMRLAELQARLPR